MRGLYRKERTDHGRQPVPAEFSVVPKADNRVRVAENPPSSAGTSPPKFLDRVRWHLRVKRYSIRTEQAYVDWIRRFILFHNKRHPEQMGEEEIAAFLSHLNVDLHVAASTQNQAFCALLFLYQQVLDRKLEHIGVERVRRPAKLPVVFGPAEACAIIDQLEGDYRLMTELLYGSGLRLMKCVRLRVKDFDFGYGSITVRDGKGLRDRVTILPERLRRPLQVQLERVQELHRRDLEKGGGGVYLPSALQRKYPNAHRSWPWQYVFPANKVSTDLRSGEVRRHHVLRKIFKTPSKAPSDDYDCRRRPAAIPSGIASPPIYWKLATIFVLCKSCLGTKTFPRQ